MNPTPEQIKEAIDDCNQFLDGKVGLILIQAAQLYLNSQSPVAVAEGETPKHWLGDLEKIQQLQSELNSALKRINEMKSFQDECSHDRDELIKAEKEITELRKQLQTATQEKDEAIALMSLGKKLKDEAKQQLQTAQADAAVMRDIIEWYLRICGSGCLGSNYFELRDEVSKRYKSHSHSSGKEVLELIKKLVAALEAQQEAHEILHAGGSNCPGCLRKQALTEAKRLGFE